MTRCFVAFEFSAASLVYLEKKAKAAHRVLVREGGWPLRLVRPENWHVTLLFFDGLEPAQRSQVWEKVAAAAGEGVWDGLVFDWRGFAVWPTPRRPSLVCLAGGEFPGTAGWPLPIEQEPFSLGKVINYRHFRPHATLMRFSRQGRRPVAGDWKILAGEMPKVAGEEIRFDRVSLFLSTLTAHQPIYPREFTAPIG